MKTIHMILIALFAFATHCVAQIPEKPSTLWVQFDDRFTDNEVMDLGGVDSIGFTSSSYRLYKYNAASGRMRTVTKSYRNNGVYRMDEVERSLVKPSEYSNVDFTKEISRWCFQRSMESEHFVCFWEKGLTLRNNTLTLGGSSVNVKTLLNNGEKIWKCYVEELGFLEPDRKSVV